MLQPNILLITIDSLRADYCYSTNKHAKKPNIDKLLNHGISFHQTISTSDSTGNSIGSIFSCLYSFKSGITHFNFNKNTLLLTDNLKKNGYTLFSTIPDLSFFKQLTTKFDKINAYVYDKRESWLQLNGGIGKQILEQLKSTKNHEPWFNFIHLMDLHAPFFIPEEFDSNEYGSNRYERMLSSIDVWLGQIIDEINPQNTLLILSSDHGDYIPLIDKEISYNTLKKRIIRKIKKMFPILEPLGLKLYEKYVIFKRKKKIHNLKTKFSSDEVRTFNMRADENLFDESIRIPLIFYGYGTNGKKEIFDQVRQIDIFPTALDICKVPIYQIVDGRSLLPFFDGTNLKEIPAYIETGSRDPKKLGNIIGIRTPKYKYLRSRIDSTQNISLFDLQNDPLEQNNLAQLKPEIVKEMENLLNEIKIDSINQDLPEFDDEETKKIQEELRKLGYL